MKDKRLWKKEEEEFYDGLFREFEIWFEKTVIPHIKHEVERWKPFEEYIKKQKKEGLK